MCWRAVKQKSNQNLLKLTGITWVQWFCLISWRLWDTAIFVWVRTVQLLPFRNITLSLVKMWQLSSLFYSDKYWFFICLSTSPLALYLEDLNILLWDTAIFIWVRTVQLLPFRNITLSLVKMWQLSSLFYSDKYWFFICLSTSPLYLQINFTCWTSVWGIHWLINSSTLTTAQSNQ